MRLPMLGVEGNNLVSPPLVAIIDDDADIVALLTDLLAEEGYATVAWHAGEGAAALIRRTLPQVVILDLRMEQPEAGMVVIEEMRADPATRSIAVVLCSANVQFVREHAERLRAEGCWIVNKPFDLATLLAAVGQAMESPPQPPRS